MKNTLLRNFILVLLLVGSIASVSYVNANLNVGVGISEESNASDSTSHEVKFLPDVLFLQRLLEKGARSIPILPSF